MELRGSDAVRALQALMGASARGARFDLRRVARAAAQGRLRSIFREPAGALLSPAYARAGREPRRALRAALSRSQAPPGAPGRPRPAGGGR